MRRRYLRALAALYIRMTFRAVDVFEILEPLLKDYRKLRLRNMCRCDYLQFVLVVISDSLLREAGFSLTYMDEFVDSLLNQERVCDIIMPRLQKRQVLEENAEIGPRKSRLLDAMEGKSDAGIKNSSDMSDRSRSRSSSRSHSPTPSTDCKASRSSRSRSLSKSQSRSRSRSMSPRLSRSRSPDLDGND